MHVQCMLEECKTLNELCSSQVLTTCTDKQNYCTSQVTGLQPNSIILCKALSLSLPLSLSLSLSPSLSLSLPLSLPLSLSLSPFHN